LAWVSVLLWEWLPAQNTSGAQEKTGVWIDVPFVKQEKDGCGAAVIAMVMQYWAHQPSERESSKPVGDKAADAVAIQRELFSARDKGIRASDLERYFKQHGFRTFAFAGKWDDFKDHLAKGRPLIVALKPSPGEKSLHYVVVTGVDWAQNVVMVNDPAQKKLMKEDRASFEKQWAAVDRWTLLAVPE
jgi:ABC-type bacteriocin/lantibiotic exporter with double-glycine peptidase domain